MITKGMIELSKKIVPVLYPTINILFGLYNTQLFVNRTIGELIAGYSDPLLSLVNTFSPGLLKDGKFSLLNGKNGTPSENYTLLTGKQSLNEIGKIFSWNGKK